MSNEGAEVYLTVRLTPRAVADEISGWREDVLELRVKAPPADGRANEAMCRLLARRLRVAPSRVAVVSGHTARIKRVRIEGLDGVEARRRLAP